MRIVWGESMASEFALADFLLSFLVAFRFPSETLQLATAVANGRLLLFYPQRGNGAIRVGETPEGPLMAAKLHRRGNMAR